MGIKKQTVLLRMVLCVCILLGCRVSLFSQLNDTVRIQEVALTVKKNSLSSIGKKTQVTDSATREQFRFANTADLLAFNGAVYIKSYGPGGIATTALRGGSAEQTAILWNGMNMQNTMLGQTDLSLLPAILFESVTIEYGGSASLWGSGAVGGSIQLGNQTRFGKQFRVSAGGAYGSQGQKNASAVIVAGNRKVVNTMKIYTAGSTNEFTYKDPSSDAVRTMSNAAYSGRGVMNELRFAPGKGHVFSFNAWLNQAHRNLPSYNSNVRSRQSQHDDALRLLGGWNFHRDNYRMQVRTSYFNEGINFNDSLFRLYTENRTATVMLDNEHYLSWGGGHEAHAGVSYLNTRATSDYYDGEQNLRRFSLLAGNKFRFFRERLLVGLNGRAEYFSATTLPLTGNFAVEYQLIKSLKAGFNLSTFYRQPTLNELYWMPGGNRNLRPEDGEGCDAVLTFHREGEHFRIGLSASAFTRHVRNWILWVPGTGGNPSPLNLQQVWSRGGESSWTLGFFSGKWRAGVNVNTSYVLSTVLKSEIPNSGSVGKQLLYTPLYTANGNLSFGFRNTSLFCLFQYAGYRYTSTDNSSWLDPYTIISLRATQAINFSRCALVLFVSVNNLLNEEYAVQAGRPMPLRSFEGGITIHINHKTKDENK